MTYIVEDLNNVRLSTKAWFPCRELLGHSSRCIKGMTLLCLNASVSQSDWLAGWLVGWLAGWLVGWLAVSRGGVLSPTP
jgi:hypothetical protein